MGWFICLFVDGPFRNKVSVIHIMVLLVLHHQGQTLTLKWYHFFLEVGIHLQVCMVLQHIEPA